MCEPICPICQKKINIYSPDYLINTDCGCQFHYRCFDKYNFNFVSITLPKCLVCDKFYKKSNVYINGNGSFEESFDVWVGNVKRSFLFCKCIGCIVLGNMKRNFYCTKHFEKYKEKYFDELKKIAKDYIGTPTNVKYVILKKTMEL